MTNTLQVAITTSTCTIYLPETIERFGASNHILIISYEEYRSKQKFQTLTLSQYPFATAISREIYMGFYLYEFSLGLGLPGMRLCVLIKESIITFRLYAGYYIGKRRASWNIYATSSQNGINVCYIYAIFTHEATRAINPTALAAAYLCQDA